VLLEIAIACGLVVMITIVVYACIAAIVVARALERGTRAAHTDFGGTGAYSPDLPPGGSPSADRPASDVLSQAPATDLERAALLHRHVRGCPFCRRVRRALLKVARR
jgi:hypothetical protein